MAVCLHYQRSVAAAGGGGPVRGSSQGCRPHGPCLHTQAGASPTGQHTTHPRCVRVYLQALTGFLASCLQGLCTACLSESHASGCCHASFFATSGRSKNVCCVYAESVRFLAQKSASVCCNFASLLRSLHHLELPACWLAWPWVKAIFDNPCNSQQTRHHVLPIQLPIRDHPLNYPNIDCCNVRAACDST